MAPAPAGVFFAIGEAMSPLASKILIVGIALLISLSWFAFWVTRLARAARRSKDPGASHRETDSAGTDSPAEHPPADSV